MKAGETGCSNLGDLREPRVRVFFIPGDSDMPRNVKRPVNPA